MTILNRESIGCKSCPFKCACESGANPDIGDFDKKSEIENQAISDGVIQLYEAIETYEFGNSEKGIFSKHHQECLKKKLTMAIELIGGANMSFNRLKEENEIKQRRGDAPGT